MTPTQKKFKKEMERGLKKLKDQNEHAYYKYISNNNLENAEQRLKSEKKEKFKNILRRFFTFIAGIIIVIIIFPSSFNKITNIRNIINNSNTSTMNNNVITPQLKQNELIEYLNKIRPYIDNISSDIKKKNSDTEQFNNKKLTQNDYIKNLQKHDELVNENITNITETTIPKELSSYINQLIEGYQLLSVAYQNESIYLKTNQEKYKEQANNNYKSSSEKLKTSDTELIKILDQNNIKHK